MPKRRLGAEQIVTNLRQVEVLQSQGNNVAAACKEAGQLSSGTSSGLRPALQRCAQAGSRISQPWEGEQLGRRKIALKVEKAIRADLEVGEAGIQKLARKRGVGVGTV